jgi:putative ABC transport system permease protein
MPVPVAPRAHVEPSAELRAAFKALAASRGFTATAVLMLGSGLALCFTVLTVINAYVIRALPYPGADRLYRIDYAMPGQPTPQGLDALDWNALDDLVEFQIAWDLDVFSLLGGEYTQSAPGAWVTPDFVPGLGVEPAVGRPFEPADYHPGAAPVAIISHRLWRTRFGGDPGVVGQRFDAYASDRPEEPESFTIIGVLPPAFWHMNEYVDVLTPLRAASYPYMARVRRGVSAAAFEHRLTALVRAGASAVPDGWRAVVTSQQGHYVAAMRPLLTAVGAGAALVLLIAGTNVCVLQLIRARRRQKDLAVRLALGATPARLRRLLACEAIILGVAATIIGVVGSRVALARLAPHVEPFLQRQVPGGVDMLALDPWVLMAASGSGVVITLLFALVPLAGTGTISLRPFHLASGRGMTEGRGSRRTRSLLVAFQVAASLTLVATTVLISESAIRMLRVDVGMDVEGVIAASVNLRHGSYPDAATRVEFYDRVLAQLAGIAGPSPVAVADRWPLQPARPRRLATLGPAVTTAEARVVSVGGDYVGTLGMIVRDGRALHAGDTAAAEPVAVISESLARRLWPGARAVGESVVIPADGADDRSVVRVVGVVSDVRQTQRDTDLLDAYLPMAQRPVRFAYLFIRDPASAAWESQVRSAVAAVDRDVALGIERSLESALEQGRAQPRVLAILLGVFALSASALALVGIYGVMAYATRHRRREVALRMALGADRGSVRRMFLRQGATMLAGGIAAGAAGAVALGQVLRNHLHEVRPHEPSILLVSALAFAACGLLAVWWPAWRASITDPALVLKEE